MEETKENKRKANHKIESKSTQILNFKVKKSDVNLKNYYENVGFKTFIKLNRDKH